ncbi:MAG: YicC family protein [Gammaproteobacteria bacterium]|nr:YicC family protein [Gammaproteobacteria bacterium]NNJ85029.1 YicC family protein [Gammaproteobacteria bacterium]
MIYSMTAFARRENQGKWGEIAWEFRSVNHRYLDIAVRLPEDLRSLEPIVRERVRDRISRGKVECLLRYRAPARQETALGINYDLARQLVGAVKEIAELWPNEGTISPLDILNWPGIVETPVPDPDAIGEPMLNVLDEALTELIGMRSREGEKLTALIRSRCTEISAIVSAVRERLPAILAMQRTRLINKLSEIKAELNPDRLEQELVIFAQKSDVAEELDRLDTHLAEVEHALTGGNSSGKTPRGKNPIGRRLDFLMQEMHREANTLSAKSVDKTVSSASVELRVLIEQMREQVQNIE